MPELLVDIADTIRSVEKLKADWTALIAAGARPGPFQDWSWIRAWLDHAVDEEGTSADRRKTKRSLHPWFVIVRERKTASPLMIWPMQLDRHIGLKRLTWFSVPALQEGNVIAAPMPEEKRQAALEAALTAIKQAPVDFLDFRLMAQDSPVASWLASRCRKGMDNAAYLVDFSEFSDWRAFELSLKSSARRSRKKRLNRMRKAGEVRFIVHEDPREIARLLDVALSWKRQWLKERGVEDALPERPWFAAFLKALPETNTGHARWVIAELSFNGRPAALDFGAIANGVFHAYLSAYDEGLRTHSPGKIALWLMLQWCMEQGLSAYDMLANPAPYKEDWANRTRPLDQYILPLSMGGRAYALWASRLRDVAAQCYHTLPENVRAPLTSYLRRLRGGVAKNG